MQIVPLRGVDMDRFTDCFNLAFSDYVIPVKETRQHMEQRNHAAGVDGDFSFVAVEGDQLAGFIMIAVGEDRGILTAFNAGTGVVPAFRGRRLVRALYDEALPLFRARGVGRCSLEVIQGNEKAIRAYRGIGFDAVCELICLRGAVSPAPTDIKVEDADVSSLDWQAAQSFWDCRPAWEETVPCVLRSASRLKALVVREGNALCGYAVYNPESGLLLQLAVGRECRGRGVGRALLCAVGSRCATVRVLNVDSGADDVLRFLKSAGLTEFARQDDMELII